MRWVIAAIMMLGLTGEALAQNACETVPAGEELTLSRPVAGSIARAFGDTWDDAKGKKTFNPGIDLEAPAGEPVYAAASGKVVEAGSQGDPGNTVRIDHGGGLETVYGHLGQAPVSAGSCVKAGEQIAVSGSAGSAPVPQIHFELRRDGKPADPTDLLQ